MAKQIQQVQEFIDLPSDNRHLKRNQLPGRFLDNDYQLGWAQSADDIGESLTEIKKKKAEQLEQAKNKQQEYYKKKNQSNKEFFSVGEIRIPKYILEEFEKTRNPLLVKENFILGFKKLTEEEQDSVKQDKIWQSLVTKFFDQSIQWQKLNEEEKKINRYNDNPNSFSSLRRKILLRINSLTKKEK